PLADALRLATADIENGDLFLDDAPIKVEGGSLTQSVAGPGAHVLRIPMPKVSNQDAKIAFTTAVATLPAINALEAPPRQLIAVASLGKEARVTTTLGSLTVSIDGQPKGTLTPEGLMVTDLTAGMHELTVGEGKDMRRMFFASGAGPALDATVYSDRDIGG